MCMGVYAAWTVGPLCIVVDILSYRQQHCRKVILSLHSPHVPRGAEFNVTILPSSLPVVALTLYVRFAEPLGSYSISTLITAL